MRPEVKRRLLERHVFFFNQKTAYENMPSLVGSEVCIRDSSMTASAGLFAGIGRSLCRHQPVSMPASARLYAGAYTHLTLPTLLRVSMRVVAAQ